MTSGTDSFKSPVSQVASQAASVHSGTMDEDAGGCEKKTYGTILVPEITDGNAEAPKAAPAKSGRMPPRTLAIIGTEFCERFCFYGLKAVLPIFLTTAPLAMADHTATVVIHGFNTAAYTATLFGALLADNWIGRYQTILWLSAVYVLGAGLLAGSAVAASYWSAARVVQNTLTRVFVGGGGLPGVLTIFYAALTLIALGTGGIKPCVSTFGGDQIDDGHEKTRETFFSWFYWAINLGSFLSMILTPYLSRGLSCCGNTTCYPAAFGVPAVLMAIALAIFWAGHWWYRPATMKKPAANGPDGNVVVRFLGYMGHSMRLPWCAAPFDSAFAADCAHTMRLFALFVPIMVFWALFDQQGSGWVFQGVAMAAPTLTLPLTKISVPLYPEQMQTVNALLILVLIPVFDKGVYPLIEKVLGRPFRETSRMLWGLALAALSFAAAAALQFVIASRSTFARDATGSLVCTANCVSILWQLPQYFLLTAAEVLVSITGLSYGFSAAPAALRTVVSAAWLLTVAGGNLVVVIVSAADPVSWFMLPGASPVLEQAWAFVLWTAIVSAATVAFFFVARSFETYMRTRVH